EIQALAKPRPDGRTGRFALLRSKFRRAAGSHFSLSEVEDAHRVALVDHFDQRTRTCQFDVVRVRGNGQNIYVFHSFFTFFSSSASATRYLKALLPLIKTTGISSPYARSRSGSVSISITRTAKPKRR